MTTIVKNDCKFLVSKSADDHVNSFWINCYAEWEQQTFEIFDKYLNKDNNFIDIGAWVGTTALYASIKSNYVYAIEADPHAIIDFNTNVKLNSFNNITLCEQPISNELMIVYFGPYSSNEIWNRSISQIKKYTTNSLDICMQTTTFSQFIDKYKIDRVSLIKIDIEGGEENIICDVFDYVNTKNPKPSIYLSFHVSWWNDKDITRFSPVWKDKYAFCYHNLKLIEPDNIVNVITNDPFCSILFTDMEF